MIKKAFYGFFQHIGVDREKVDSLLKESEDLVAYQRSIMRNGKYWQISKDEIRTMYCIVKNKNPSTVIETGMGPGVSTTVILTAIHDKARFISIDPDKPFGKGDRKIGFVIPEELRGKLEYVKGTSREKLKDVLTGMETLDIFFHDSDHSYENVMFELTSVKSKLLPSSLILIDNYNWSEAPEDFSKSYKMNLWHISDDLALLST